MTGPAEGELVVMCRHINPSKIRSEAYGFWEAVGVKITCSCHGQFEPKWLALCEPCALRRKGKRPIEPGQHFDGKHLQWTGPTMYLESVQ